VSVSDCERVCIQFDDGTERWAAAIDRLDAGDVFAGDLPCRSASGLLVLNERTNRCLLEIEGARGFLERMDVNR
jgi:hypothetical protein